MMGDCQRTVGRLASYVDKLLPPAEQADVERHLDACPPCRAAATHELGARTVLREQAPRLTDEPLPPGLRSRCEALVRDRSSAAAAPRVYATRRFATLTTLMTLAVSFFVFSLATHRSETVLAAQLTADHAKCFRLFSNNQSPDADARRVEQMLEQAYGWDLHIPPSSTASGIRLLGARRCLYADGTLPHVMYRVGGHDVSLYVMDGVARPAGDLVRFGHHTRLWTTGDRTYILVWPVAAGDISPAVRYVMSEAR